MTQKMTTPNCEREMLLPRNLPRDWEPLKAELQKAKVMTNPSPGRGFHRYKESEWPKSVRVYQKDGHETTFKVYFLDTSEYRTWLLVLKNYRGNVRLSCTLFSMKKAFC